MRNNTACDINYADVKDSFFPSKLSVIQKMKKYRGTFSLGKYFNMHECILNP
jgi:hypothetical protein